jgi:hypothetical protein
MSILEQKLCEEKKCDCKDHGMKRVRRGNVRK